MGTAVKISSMDVRRSRIWMGAPWTLTVPGTVVSVVKSISDTSEWVPVNFDMRVDCMEGINIVIVYRGR
jgi:hypothetical protein